MRRDAVIVALLCVAAGAARADSKDEDPDNRDTPYIGGGGFVPEAVPGVNPLLAPPSTTGLAAAITPKTSGTQFTVTLVPEKLGLPQPLRAGSTITVGYDSKNTLTSLASTVVLYDPFSTSGPRVAHTIQLLDAKTGCGGTYLEDTQAAAEVMSRQRIEAQKAVDDAIGPYAKGQAQAVRDDVEAKWKALHARELEAEVDCTAAREAAEWSRIYRTGKPKVTLSVATGVFPSGRGVDPMSKDMLANAPLEPFRGVSGELRFLFRPHERLSFDLWGSLKNTRPTGAPRTRRSITDGGGSTLAVLVRRFKNKNELQDDPAYIADGFIPGIGVGASFQTSHCYGGPYCESGKLRTYSLTLFVDIKIKEDVQFRLAVPFEQDVNVSTSNAIAITPTFTLATTVGALK